MAVEIAEQALLSVASRPKTLDSIISKLARETTRLSQMQDIAGGRIVLPHAAAQEGVVEAFVEHEDARVIRFTDTRERGDALG